MPRYDSLLIGLDGLIKVGISKQINILANNSPIPLMKGMIVFLIPCRIERDI
jgi:hypothetical protein